MYIGVLMSDFYVLLGMENKEYKWHHSNVFFHAGIQLGEKSFSVCPKSNILHK